MKKENKILKIIRLNAKPVHFNLTNLKILALTIIASTGLFSSAIYRHTRTIQEEATRRWDENSTKFHRIYWNAGSAREALTEVFKMKFRMKIRIKRLFERKVA